MADLNTIFTELNANLGKHYKGDQYRLLKFCLCDHLPFGELDDRLIAHDLFNKLERKGDILPTNVNLLLEIAELTQVKAAENLVLDYIKINKVQNSDDIQPLSPYLKRLFKALQQVQKEDMDEVIAYYKLRHVGFHNMWDVVFHLESNNKLGDKQDKVETFSSRLNERAKHLLLAKDKKKERLHMHQQVVKHLGLQENSHRNLTREKLAIPLLIPVTDVPNKEWEMIVWGMRKITKKWQASSGLSCQKSMVVERLPIVSALRLGRPKLSKSKVVNYVLNEQKHDIFFNSGSKGGNLEQKLSDGLLEMAWYLPTKPGTFSDAINFINLRGNALTFKSQTNFLSEISQVTIAFVSCADFNEDHTQLLKSLYQQKGHVIFILDGSPGKDFMKALQTIKKCDKYKEKQVDFIKSSNMNELRIASAIWGLLKVNLISQNDFRSIEMCIEVAKKMNYHVDETKDCLEAKESAKKLLERVTREGKQNELPLQMATVKIGETKKEQHRLQRKEKMQIEDYVDRLKKEIEDLRQKQLNNKDVIVIMTDGFSISRLQPIRENYITKWNALCNNRKTKQETSKALLKSRQNELDELEQKLSRESLGLEHFNREIGQDYEMSSDLKLSTSDTENSILADVAAEMLLEGYPIELMDGDAGCVSITWIKAVFNSLKEQIGNKIMFVLSVLGIQSSGKSTMLNAMFGLQFSVSAGRCTKGIFVQLVSLDKSLREETQCDYILVVDTEGLRSPEFASIQQANYRDNELATLVIGLGDLIIINIMGENPTDMQDTLQIAVNAFMKMDNVKVSPNCLFVHQNVTDVTESALNTAKKRSMREMLDKITSIAAKEENCSEKYESFSDVINFQENKHILYISSLLQGDPPMAPPNPSYSKCILQIQAYNALNAEYVRHARTFRRNVLEHSYSLQNECKKLTVEKIKQDGEKIFDSYLQKLQKDICDFEANMKSYLEEEKNACQWKVEIELQLQNLGKEIKKDLRDEFTSIRNKRIVRATGNIDMQFIYRKAKDLADVYRGKQLSDADLEREFAKNWIEWVCAIPIVDDYADVRRSFESILREFYLRHHQSDVNCVLQSDLSQTEIVEKDLYFRSFRVMNTGYGFMNKQRYLFVANSFKKDILNRLKKKISNHKLNGGKYSIQIGFDLFSELSSNLKEINIEGNVCIKEKSNIRLSICNFMVELIPSLERMQEQHKCENDPRLYMESQRDELWQMFKGRV
ncbi:interferon-induced very large GTPase 1-like [Antedon mediterranea]|uniref:interferon-induced very large GTPase 1-like n=1 Tax=Antedon mediterranea TaxID=105859 RepID=UPI003AF798E7